MSKHSLFALVLIGAGIVGTYAADPPASKPASSQPSPQTSLIRHGSLSIVIDSQGSFDPVDPFEVRLRLKSYTGDLTITSIVPNGSTVKKGDILLEINPDAMQRLVAAAENDLLIAKANLEKYETDAKVGEQVDALALRQQEDAVKEAEQSVKWFETVDGPQMLKGIDIQVAAARNQMSDEQDELDQLKKMYKSEELTNATADIVVKRALRQLELSKVGYTMSEERATKTRTYSYPIAKQRVYDALESARQSFAYFQASQRQTKILRKTSMAAFVAAADAANLKLNELKGDAEKFVVRSPSDGVIAYGQVINGTWSGGDARVLRPGEKVTSQTVLMTLYHPGRLRLALELPETKFFAIQPGQKASVSPVAFPEFKYEGMTDVVARTGGTSGGNYPLTISTGNVDPHIVPGLKAQIHMDVKWAEDVLLAPVSAVSDSKVWVKTNGGIEERHVLTGRSDAKSIEILSGLHEGDRVLTQAKK